MTTAALGPGDRDFDALARIARRALKKAGVTEELDQEAKSAAYMLAEALATRVEAVR